MKRINSILLVSCIAVVAALVPQKAMAVAATFENHVVKLTGVPEGAGKVYLSLDWKDKEEEVIDDALYVADEMEEKGTIETKDYYAICRLYAKPNDGYKFAGFFIDADADGLFDITADNLICCTADSKNKDYTQLKATNVYLPYETKEYSGGEGANVDAQTAANRTAAETAAETDYATFGCKNHFFAVFYKDGEENPLEKYLTSAQVVNIGGQNNAATLCCEHRLDFSSKAKDMTPYYASALSGDKVVMTSITDVPAGTGVVLQGLAGNYIVPFGDGTSTVDGNLLVGVTVATKMKQEDGGNTNFILAEDNGLGFFKVKDDTELAAGKAYLSLPTASLPASSAIGIRFDGTTNISKPQADFTTGEWYSIDGRKLNEQPTERGLYIVNGKKVIIK